MKKIKKDKKILPTPKTIKILFARSGNRCAFPNCVQELIVKDKKEDIVIGEICHIESPVKGGPRYSSTKSPQELANSKNLLLLCPSHHKIIDSSKKYTVKSLQKIKKEHEEKEKSNKFKIKDKNVLAIITQLDEYWKDININNRHAKKNLSMLISFKEHQSPIELIERFHPLLGRLNEINESLLIDDQKLEEEVIAMLDKISWRKDKYKKIEYYNNPLVCRHIEYLTKALPNHLIYLEFTLVQLQIAYLGEYLKNNSKDKKTKNYFNSLQKIFLKMATSYGLSD